MKETIKNTYINTYGSFDWRGYAEELELELSICKRQQLDFLNWAKSELKTVTKQKLGLTMTPYRSEKLKFLRAVMKIINV